MHTHACTHIHMGLSPEVTVSGYLFEIKHLAETKKPGRFR